MNTTLYKVIELAQLYRITCPKGRALSVVGRTVARKLFESSFTYTLQKLDDKPIDLSNPLTLVCDKLTLARIPDELGVTYRLTTSTPESISLRYTLAHGDVPMPSGSSKYELKTETIVQVFMEFPWMDRELYECIEFIRLPAKRVDDYTLIDIDGDPL